MDICSFSDVKISLKIDGNDYILTTKPKSIRAKNKKHVGTAYVPPVDDVVEAINSLGFTESCVDVTLINEFLGKPVNGRVIAAILSDLGYTDSFRFKHEDGRNHYVRYNFIFTTAQDALAELKGR